MVTAVTGFPARSRRRPHGGPAASRRYERRRPEKTPLHKIVSENLESWLAWREAAERPDAAAAADMLAWENSGFSIDASVRISLLDCDVPSYFRSLEHLLRYCARPPFALERLSVRRGSDGRISRIRYVLPRHKAANWVGRGRGRKSTRPGANGVVEITPFEFLDRLADLVPPPRKHRHRYHGVFAPNHKLRKAVTALAVGNIGKPRDPGAGGHAGNAHATGCCDTHAKPRSHDTSRIAWAKLMARVGEEFPLECPACGGDIRLISFITEPGPIRKILTPVLPHTEWRTTRTAAHLASSRPARRLGRVRPGPLSTATSFKRHPTSRPRSTSKASDGIPCYGADDPREERFQGRSAPTRKTQP